MERNAKTFDIGNPLEAYQFATFLVRLARHSAELQRQFERVKDEVYQDTKMMLESRDFKIDEFKSWTKITQPASTSKSDSCATRKDSDGSD